MTAELVGLALEALVTALEVALGLGLLTPLLGWACVRFRTAGWLAAMGLQGLASVPAVLLAAAVLVPYQVASLLWPAAQAAQGGRGLFALVVLVAALPPGLLAFRRTLLDLEQALGLVARSRGWGRGRLLWQFLAHPEARRQTAASVGSGLIQLANLELLVGFLGEAGLGGGLSGAHRSWGQVLIRLREPERYGYRPEDLPAVWVVCLALLFLFYGVGSWLSQGERRVDYP